MHQLATFDVVWEQLPAQQEREAVEIETSLPNLILYLLLESNAPTRTVSCRLGASAHEERA